MDSHTTTTTRTGPVPVWREVLATQGGTAVRPLLKDHPSTKVELGIEPAIGRRPWTFPNGKLPQVHADGITIDPRIEYVYDKPLAGRTLYLVSIASLLDASLSSGADADRGRRMAELRATGNYPSRGGEAQRRRGAKNSQRMKEQAVWEAEHGPQAY